jgi:hypothetical protein
MTCSGKGTPLIRIAVNLATTKNILLNHSQLFRRIKILVVSAVKRSESFFFLLLYTLILCNGIANYFMRFPLNCLRTIKMIPEFFIGGC